LSGSRCRTAVLISGSGSNLQSFIDRVASRELALDIATVFSSRADAYGLTRAADAGIHTCCIDHADYADRKSFDQALAHELDQHQPNLLVLAGFMRILSPWFVDHYAGKILNIHPALLPAYPGLNTHQRVLDAGEEWHGSTVHFVTDELDGGPRVLQGRLPVDLGESADQLAKRVQAVEHQIYPEAANWFAEGRLELRDGTARLDGEILAEPIVREFE
jgi:phosphoribosylglycinamide formyltransferase-1